MKKYISIVIAFLLIMSFMSIPVFAGNKSVSDSNAEKLYTATGAVALPASDDANIKRGDFIQSVISALGFNLSGSAQKQYFADVSADSTLGKALEYALAFDIISPAEYYNPDNYVTYPQAAKILVTALGYGEEAKGNGGYPVGYLTLAQKYRLFKGVGTASEAPVLKSDFYTLMRNFLEADMRTVDSVSSKKNTTVVGYVTEGNVLECMHGWEYFEGIITADENTSLYDADIKYSDAICVDGRVMKYNGKYTLGTHVFGYCNEEDGEIIVKYLEASSKNDIVFIDGKDIESASGTSINKLNPDGRIENYQLNGLYSVLYNGKTCFISLSDLTNDIDVEGVTLIDNNSDGLYDVCLIQNGKIMEVAGVNESTEMIYDAHSPASIDFSPDSNVRVYKGEDPGFINSVKKGSIIEYYTSEDGKFSEIYILDNEITGKLTGKAGDNIFIDEKEYKIKSYFKDVYYDKLVIGTENSFVLSRDGSIAAVSASVSEMKLAYLSGFKLTTKLSDFVELRLFTEDSNLATYETDNKVVLNGDVVSAQDLYNSLAATGEQLIRFSLNAEGKVKKINTVNSLGIFDSDVDSPDSLKRYNYPDYNTTAEVRLQSNGVFNPYYSVSNADTKVFIVYGKDDVPREEDRFEMGTITSIPAGPIEAKKVEAYNVNKAGRAEVIIYRLNLSQESISTNATTAGFVVSVTDALNPLGDPAYKLLLCYKGAYITLYVSKTSFILNDSDLSDGNGHLNLGLGDAIKYKEGKYSEAVLLTRDFRYSDNIKNGSYNFPLSFGASSRHAASLYYGTVVDIKGDAIGINVIGSTFGDSDLFAGFIFTGTSVWLMDTEKGTMTSVLPSTIVTDVASPGHGDKILIKIHDSRIQDMVIIR